MSKLAEPEQPVCRLRYEGNRPEDRRIFVLEDKPGVIGRSSDCDWVLNHESVSRAHARFSRHRGTWMITDLDSKNGVRLNTFRIREEPLRDADRIDLGTARLVVEIIPAQTRQGSEQVEFVERDLPSQHTEVFELAGLSSLLAAPDKDLASTPSNGPIPIHTELGRSGEAIRENDEGSMLSLISEAAEALISSNSLDDTLERILALVFNNLPAERGLICLYDEASHSNQPTVMRTKSGIPEEPIQVSSNIVSHVLKKKQALLVRNTMMDDRFGGAASVIMMEIRSAMCAPLYREGRVAGFVYVDRQSGNEPFDTPHLHALSTLAVISAVAVETAALHDKIRHEQELKARLARYSSPGVVEQILKAPNSGARSMVADEREVTVLFADLEGFTAMAESLPSTNVIQMLNRVFERLTEVVFSLEGTLDKFRGDGMMAFFGAPLAMEDHAERAVEAALRMQAEVHQLSLRNEFTPELRMRVGINSGSVVVGDIGSPQRKDYTAVGDVVNTASRLESEVARAGQVVIGESTWERVNQSFDCQSLGQLRLRGKRKTVRPYRVESRKSD